MKRLIATYGFVLGVLALTWAFVAIGVALILAAYGLAGYGPLA
jgi:hypothetical protein